METYINKLGYINEADKLFLNEAKHEKENKKKSQQLEFIIKKYKNENVDEKLVTKEDDKLVPKKKKTESMTQQDELGDNFCQTCKKKNNCSKVCTSLNLYLNRLEPKIYKKDIFMQNLDCIMFLKAPLSLAEMETVVVRAQERHLVDMNFNWDDWEIVENSTLTKRQKIILYRHYWQKKTVRTIAKEFGVSHAAIGYALQRARTRLKPYLLEIAEKKNS